MVRDGTLKSRAWKVSVGVITPTWWEGALNGKTEGKMGPAERRSWLLRTCLLPLQAQGNEELVRLQVDADTGNLRLLDMLLNLDLFLSLAVDRWTACVTH